MGNVLFNHLDLLNLREDRLKTLPKAFNFLWNIWQTVSLRQKMSNMSVEEGTPMEQLPLMFNESNLTKFLNHLLLPFLQGRNRSFTHGSRKNSSDRREVR